VQGFDRAAAWQPGGAGLIDLSLQQLVLRFIAYVFIAAVHGFAVAAIAVALGDPGPRYDGRLRLNPAAHLDIIGTASGLLFSAGWIRPIAIDPAALRVGRIGSIFVVIAAAAATLLGAVALWLLRPLILPLLPDTASTTAFALIETIGELSLWFALFNVLPLPPLTGAHLIAAVMPKWRDRLRKSQPYAAVGLAILAATGVFTSLLAAPYRILAALVLGE
jgi:Zn-dependent protease